MKRIFIAGAAGVLALSLAGCTSSLSDPYVLEERIPVIAAEAAGDGYYAEPFTRAL